jgi:hypothetical protein
MSVIVPVPVIVSVSAIQPERVVGHHGFPREAVGFLGTPFRNLRGSLCSPC